MATVYKSLSKSSGQKEDESRGPPQKYRQRVLILSSRGITYRHRHLLNDLASLLPHGKRDVKFDTKSKLYQLNELAELYNCTTVLFAEARKGQDLYIWMSRVPNGPAVKMHLQNLHTMEELQFTGNCLKGSRPILSFDAAFETEPHLQLMRELLRQIFGVPPSAKKSKPFIDHVMSFTILDGKIWIRNYQINEAERTKGPNGEADTSSSSRSRPGGNETELNLIEIGPRFLLTPIVIQEGSFGGPIIYENKQFVSPNQVRADLRKRKASRHNARAEQQVERLGRKGDLGLRTDSGHKTMDGALDTRQLFA